MESSEKRVVFADRMVEKDYDRLSQSQHPEDERVWEVLTEIRANLKTHWREGQRVSPKLASAYLGRHPPRRLWQLEIPSHGLVVYSISGGTVLIVDIL